MQWLSVWIIGSYVDNSVNRLTQNKGTFTVFKLSICTEFQCVFKSQMACVILINVVLATALLDRRFDNRLGTSVGVPSNFLSEGQIMFCLLQCLSCGKTFRSHGAIKPYSKRRGGVGGFLTTFSAGSVFSARSVAVSPDSISTFSITPVADYVALNMP